MQSPAVVLRVQDRVLISANRSACDLTGLSRDEIELHPTSLFIPDYLLPGSAEVKEWAVSAATGNGKGMPLDLLLEIPGKTPQRLTGQMGPADIDGEHAIVIFDQASQDHSGMSAEEAISVLLADIGRIVGSSLDLQAVCEQFATSLTQVAPADHIAILLKGDQDETLHAEFVSGYDAPFEVKAPPYGAPIAQSIETHTLILLDSEEIHKSIAEDPGASRYIKKSLSSLCCVPLVSSGELVGVALLGSAQPNAFTQDDLSLLEQVGSHVAGAISNVALHRELSRNSKEREALASIGRIASSSMDFAGALPEIGDEILLALPLATIAIYESLDEKKRFTQTYRWNQTDPSINMIDSKIEPVIAECLSKSTAAMSTLSGGHCAIATPLMVGARPVGAIVVVMPSDSELSTRDIAFINRIANQLAGAVHSSRVYQKQQRESKLRRALADLSLAISQDMASERIFERLADEVAELVEYDLLSIALVEPDRSGLRARFQVGVDEEVTIHESIDATGGAISFEPRSRIVTDIESAADIRCLAEAGFTSFLEVSIGAPDSPVIGYLAIASRERHKFSDLDMESLALAAAQVAPYIQNAISHEQAIALAEARTSEAKAEARTRELERISEAKSQFLSIVSHELRTPLTSIIAYSELFERNAVGNLNDKQQNQAKVVARSANHLKFLISDLLDVSRMESGNFSLTMSNFDVGELGEDIAESLVPVLNEKNQTLNTQIAQESLHIHGDQSRIAQVLSNILENASKYSAAGTVITLDIHRTKDDVVISVIDKGIGISEEDQDQLFTPFFRANSGLTRTEPGTGLGLSLVKKISEMHGGVVSVKSQPNMGSTFTVSFKAASDSQAA